MSFTKRLFIPNRVCYECTKVNSPNRQVLENIKGLSGKLVADEASRKRWIEVVDVKGKAAIGKIILEYPTTYFVVYFAFLKNNGEWKSINKTFYQEWKEQPKE